MRFACISKRAFFGLARVPFALAVLAAGCAREGDPVKDGGGDDDGAVEEIEAKRSPSVTPSPLVFPPPSSGGPSSGGTSSGGASGGTQSGGGTGGAASGGASSGGGGAGGTGGSASLPVDPARETSSFCGDGVRDPLLEECDDGPSPPLNGNFTDVARSLRWDVCSDNCQTRDVLLVNPAEFGDENAKRHRRLGAGAHAAAGSVVPLAKDRRSAGAVAWLDAHPMPKLWVEVLDIHGNPSREGRDSGWKTDRSTIAARRVDVGFAATVPLAANAVVGGLPDGSYVVAFNELNGDGAELGVALRRVDLDGTVGDLGFANSTTLGAQFDPDVLWTSRGLAVVWTDTSRGSSAPAVKLRFFGATLGATSGELTLGGSTEGQGSVALAYRVPPSGPFEGGAGLAPSVGVGLIAAYREIRTGTEGAIVLVADPFEASETRVTIVPSENDDPGVGPGPIGEVPAVTGLDPDHALVVFSVGTDPGNTGVQNLFRLRAAIVRWSTREVVYYEPLEPLAPGIVGDATRALTTPRVLAVAEESSRSTEIYLGWRSEGALGSARGDDLWLKRVLWRPPTGPSAPVVDLGEVEVPLTRTSVGNYAGPGSSAGADHGVGDQRAPSLALLPIDGSRVTLLGAPASPLHPGGTGAFAFAWEDWGTTFDPFLRGDFEALLSSSEFEPEQASPDIALQLAPLPLRRGPPVESNCAVTPCSAGQGPCSLDSQCASGLVCLDGRGPAFGFGVGVAQGAGSPAERIGVCGPATCENGVLNAGETAIDCGGSCGRCFSCPPASQEGTAPYCSAVCPCANLKGDCDSNADCAGSRICAEDRGAQFGQPAAIDVCMVASCTDGVLNGGETRLDCGGAYCGPCRRGVGSFCSASVPCAEGDGSCATNAECGAGLRCSSVQAELYGLSSDQGVCVAEGCVDGRLVGSAPLCSSACRCPDGQGPCTDDSECLGRTFGAGGPSPGQCVAERGLYFGLPVDAGVCLPSSCLNGHLDAGETQIDCGGVCGGECPACAGNRAFRSFEFPANSSNPPGSRGFEYAGESGGVTWSKVTDATEGAEAVRFAGCGFTRVRSPTFVTSDFEIVGDELLLDAKLRTVSGAPVPAGRSLGEYRIALLERSGKRTDLFVGDFAAGADPLKESLGAWRTLRLAVTPALRAFFLSGKRDLRLEIDLGFNCGLTDPLTLDLDNLRFGGNAVFQSECSTTGSSGGGLARSVLGFESSAQWTSAQVAISSTTTRSEGNAAIEFPAVTATLTSASFPARNLEADARMLVDIRLPVVSGGVGGGMTAYLSCPAEGVTLQSLGFSPFKGTWGPTNFLPMNEWRTISFSVPPTVVDAVASGLGDCSIRFDFAPTGIPAGNTVRLDNLRFAPASYCANRNLIDVAPFEISNTASLNGQPATPYHLCTAAQFQHVMNTSSLWASHYLLDQDVDLAGVSGTIGNETVHFSGSFNGQNFELSNFTRSSPGSTGVGLFSRANATISNVRLNNFRVGGLAWVGPLSGISYGNISNVHVFGGAVVTDEGAVTVGGLVGNHQAPGVLQLSSAKTLVGAPGVRAHYLGGLVGFTNSTVRTSNSSSYVFAEYGGYWGGVIGGMFGGTLEDLAATGEVGTSTFGDQVGGLIGTVQLYGATIRRCTSSARVLAENYVGGLVGSVFVGHVTPSVRVEDSSSTGHTTGTRAFTGGLVGLLEGGEVVRTLSTGRTDGTYISGGLVGHSKSSAKVFHSSAVGPVTAFNQGGGLVGVAFETTVFDSYARSNVSQPAGEAGGLFGRIQNSTVRRAYASGTVAASVHRGTLVGFQDGSMTYEAVVGRADSNPGLAPIGNATGVVGVENLSASDFGNFGSYTARAWDTNFVWRDGGAAGPELLPDICTQMTQTTTAPFVVGLPVTPNGSAAHPYPVCTSHQVQAIANTTGLWTSHFALLNDLSLVGVTGQIGTATTAYAGTFDGRGRTLSNFTNTTGGDDRGLFGVVSGTVRDLTVSNFVVSGNSQVGAMVGRLQGGTLLRATANNPTVSGVQRVGGLAGRSVGGTILTSGVVGGTVTGTGTQAGGLLGTNSPASLVSGTTSSARVIFNQGANNGDSGAFVGLNESVIEFSSASGNIEANFTGSGASTILSIGGFVGQNGTSGGAGQIRNCSASGSVLGRAAEMGGLVGTHGNTGSLIENSTSSGSVEQTDTARDYVGGLVGRVNAGTVRLSSASGSVSGRYRQVGGLIGRLEGSGSLVERSFATGNVTARHEQVGGLIGTMLAGTTVRRSYARGTARSETQRIVGGLVGLVTSATIEDSYSWGAVTASTQRAGSLIGYITTGGTIRRSYGKGTVTCPNDRRGSFVGEVAGTGTTITGSLGSSTANSGFPFIGLGSANATLSNSTNVTQSALDTQSTYTSRSWNFTTIWIMATGGAVLR